MAHIPVNHHLQRLYRLLAGASGGYVLAFGVAGLLANRGEPVFAREDLPWVLGLRANRSFAILSIAAGAVIVVGAVIGRNLDRWVNLVGGAVFLVSGMAMMSLMQTELNLLGFTMTTCVVSFVIGLVLLTAGLYGKTGSRREAQLEELFRHGEIADPQEHPVEARDAPGSPARAEQRPLV